MDDNMQNAITLMVVGMMTVFLILFLLVTFSKLLIRVVNRYIPEPVKEKLSVLTDQATLAPNKFAAIIAAVEAITKGKGRIQKIEKSTEDPLR